MTSADQTPIYNLKAVVRQTGLKPDTLRAWERRYGVPNPQRTESGHRLYSPYDIEVILWLMERQNEGMSIGRAVDLWCQLDAGEGDPLEAPDFNSGPASTRYSSGHHIESASEDQLGELRSQWINACLQFDERSAEDALTHAFSLFPTEIVCTFVLQNGLAEIGAGWHQGNITVQQEHFASALAIRRLEAILTGMPAPNRPGRIMIGCPAEEEHTFPTLLLTVLLRRRGYDIVYLGANVPLRSMEVTISTTRPRLVILTAQQLFTAATLLETAQLLQKEKIATAFGGLIFSKIPELAEVIPGYYLGDDIEASLGMVEQILVTARSRDAAKTVSEQYVAARDHFRHHQAEIEADVWNRLVGNPVPDRQLETANRFMGRNIQAALFLGNLDYVGPDLIWIEELLVHYYEMPSMMVNRYLQVYCQAADNRLDERGSIIVDWFRNLLGLDEDHLQPDLTRPLSSRQFADTGTGTVVNQG